MVDAVAAAAMPIPKAGLFGRLAQGLVGVGSRFAPAIGAAQAAAPAVRGAIQGVGMGAGFAAGQLVAQPMKGFVGWFVNFWPENIYGAFLWGAAFIYWLDWQTGFNAQATANFHLGLAILAFLLIGLTQRFLNVWALLSATAMFLSLLGFLNADVMRERIFATAALVMAFFFYSRVNAPGFFKLLPLVAFVDVYGMPVFRDVVLGYAANISYISFAAALIFNRILFPIWLWFGALALYENTRVAKRILTVMIIFYFVASLPTITSAYKAKVSGLTPEEKEVAQGIFARFQTNMQRIVSGEFLKTPVAAAYEKAAQLYGFGEAKEQPKMGLQLRDDPNMPKVFDLNFYDAPAPSVIMEVPNPLPVDDPAKRAIKVVDIGCTDKSGSSQGQGSVVEPSPPPSSAEPVLVSYKRPRTAKCAFPSLKEGSYTVEIKVKYGFEADAELATAFMRSDKLEALLAAGEDPAVINKIPPASAEYDNGPVAITWGPVEMVTSPASVDIPTSEKEIGFMVYVTKSGAWEGEIAGISSLELTVPQGVKLVLTYDMVLTYDKKCAFEVSGTSDKYKVKEDIIIRQSDKTPRFVGDGIQFACKMKVSSNVLSGADSAGAQFKVHVNYVFSTKKAVSFEVKPKEGST